MPQSYVIGDIHGAYNALIQCLERADFNYELDHLICLGDVCDGWPDTKRCIDELQQIKHLTYLLGNHDLWLLDWMRSGVIEKFWVTQGGSSTIASYSNGVPSSHINFLEKALPYFRSDEKLFVHAGIDPKYPVEQQDLRTLLWDRTLVQKAWELLLNETSCKLTIYDEVYIGHTPIPFSRPIQSCEIWMMDTGAGWSGVLSMMNINTKEIFTSDFVPHLYPGVQGRTKKE